MKHKYIFRTMTALCAALLIVGGLSVPAYAQTPEGQDATNDDNVIVELTRKRIRRPLRRRATPPWWTITAAISDSSPSPLRQAIISISLIDRAKWGQGNYGPLFESG